MPVRIISIKHRIVKKNKLNTKGKTLAEDFINIYGQVKLDYSKLTIKQKEKYIKIYRKNNKIKNNTEVNIKDALNLNIICNSVARYLTSYKSKKEKLHDLLLEYKLNNEDICNCITVKYNRNNKDYIKKIYIFMNKEMIKNLIKNTEIGSQFFSDCTYYCIPRINNNFKLFIIIAFNKDILVSQLCVIALIRNENIETFTTIYNYLYEKYKFVPKKMTVDCQKAHLISLYKFFPNTCVIICYFHIIRRLVIHLNDLKNKNLNKKENAKNLLSCMKLLLFVPTSLAKEYFELIRVKYLPIFPSFIKYFYINFFMKFPLNKMIWLYDQYNLLLFDDSEILFFTNNIVESCNRILNSHYIGNIKSFNNFKNSINELMEIYSSSNRKYKENLFSVTKALAYYAKNNQIKRLITYKDLIKIYEAYIKFKKIKINLEHIEDLYEDIYNKELDNKAKVNEYSDNESSDSSIDEEEYIVFNYNVFNNDNKNDSDEDSDDISKSKKTKNNNIKTSSKVNNNRGKSKNYYKYKKNNNEEERIN